MIALLGMYDRPETSGANDAFWSLIRSNLGYGPERLTRGVDVWQAVSIPADVRWPAVLSKILRVRNTTPSYLFWQHL